MALPDAEHIVSGKSDRLDSFPLVHESSIRTDPESWDCSLDD